MERLRVNQLWGCGMTRLQLVKSSNSYIPTSRPEAELGVVAACLYSPAEAWDAVQAVEPAFLQKPLHRAILEAFKESDGKGDAALLAARLRDSGVAVSMSEMDDFRSFLPHADRIQDYANVVVRSCLMEKAQTLSLQVRDLIATGAPAVDTVLALVEAVQGAESASPWPEPVPLEKHDLPTFPLQCLPPVLRSYSESLAEGIQVPEAYPGTMLLSAVAAAVQGKMRVAVDQGKSWYEPLSIYTCVIGEPGTNKTTILDAALEPIRDWEEARTAELAGPLAEALSARKILEGRLSAVEKRAMRAKDGEGEDFQGEIARLAEEIAAFELPRSGKLLVEDVTPEQLALEIYQNGPIGLFSDEGGIFGTIAGRYSQGVSNLDVYLKSHSESALKVSRVSGRDITIRRPCLTIGLSIQKDVIQGLAGKSEFRGRGLLARFLFAWPKETLGFRPLDAPDIPKGLVAEYSRALKFLLDIPAGEAVEGDDGKTKTRPWLLRQSEASAQVFRRWCAFVEHALRPDGELGMFRDWGGKLKGTTARLAGILHCADMAERNLYPWQYTISQRTMEDAVRLAIFFMAHMRAVFTYLGVDANYEAAAKLLSWIQQKKLASFKRRDLLRGLAQFKKNADLEGPLAILKDRGFIRQTDGKGADYIVNPRVLSPLSPVSKGIYSFQEEEVYHQMYIKVTGDSSDKIEVGRLEDFFGDGGVA